MPTVFFGWLHNRLSIILGAVHFNMNDCPINSIYDV